MKLAKDFLAFAKLSLDANKEIWNTLGFDPVNMDVWNMKDVTHNPENKFVKYFVNNPFDVLNEIKDEIRLIKSTAGKPDDQQRALHGDAERNIRGRQGHQAGA